MKALLVVLGLWTRLIIIGLLNAVGMVHVTCGLIRMLYRVSPALARRPLWTGLITHLLVFAVLVFVLVAVLRKLLEMVWTTAA